MQVRILPTSPTPSKPSTTGERPFHVDLSRTLRQYCDALPLHDLDIANRLDHLLSD